MSDEEAWVRDFIRPATRRRRCRYVELLKEGVGRATVFVSHAWGAPYEDLVAAVGHALNGDETALPGERFRRGHCTHSNRRLPSRGTDRDAL